MAASIRGKCRRASGLTKYAIANYWYDHGDFVFELDVPQCFACGAYASFGQYSTIETGWNASRLERAHIIADSIGGSISDPGNFVLLCQRCHREAPMTNQRHRMIEWVKRRETFWNWLFRTTARAMHEQGVTTEDIEYLNQLDRDKLREAIDGESKKMQIDYHPDSFWVSAPAAMAVLVKSLAEKRFVVVQPLD